MLQRMSQGGIYDHLGGGYARYSTDEIWLVPHFEKMLYDNAQLLELLALAHAHRPDPLYAQRAAETVGWMIRDMTAQRIDGQAAFAASEDADSEGEEGRFYVWTEAEIDALLGAAAAAAFKRAYDVTPNGNWEGHTILRRVTPPGTADEEAALADVARKSCSRRAKSASAPAGTTRCWPTGTGWRSPRWPAPRRCSANPRGWTARGEAFDFILRHMAAPHGGVEHAWRLGRVTAPGLIEDQAAMARAALALHEATGDATYLATAERLANAAQDGLRRRSRRLLFHRRRRIRRAARPSAHRRRQRHPRRQRHDGGGPGPPVPPDRQPRLAHPNVRRAERLRRPAGPMAGMPTLLAAADLLEEATSVVVAGSRPTPTVSPCCWSRCARLIRPLWCCAPPIPECFPRPTRRMASRRGPVRPWHLSAGGTCAACRTQNRLTWPGRYGRAGRCPDVRPHGAKRASCHAGAARPEVQCGPPAGQRRRPDLNRPGWRTRPYDARLAIAFMPPRST